MYKILHKPSFLILSRSKISRRHCSQKLARTAHQLLHIKGDLSYSVVFAHSSDSVGVCAALMKAHAVGSLLVRDNEGRTIGIVTERDFVLATATSDKPLHTKNVKELMTPVDKLISVTPNTEMKQIMIIMQQHKIRHLPVMSDNNLVGMLSVRDILMSVLDDSSTKNNDD